MTDEKIIEFYFQRNEIAIKETSKKYGACQKYFSVVTNTSFA